MQALDEYQETIDEAKKRLVFIASKKIKEAMIYRCWNLTTIAQATGLSKVTVMKARNGDSDGVGPKAASKILNTDFPLPKG